MANGDPQGITPEERQAIRKFADELIRLRQELNSFRSPGNRFLRVIYDRELLGNFTFFLEVVVVSLICSAVVFLGFSAFVWVLWGFADTPMEVIHRLHRIFKSLDEHWKSGLILLLPLLYRIASLLALQAAKALNLSQGEEQKKNTELGSNPRATGT